jgi:uncharacterized membrane protein
MPLAPWFAVMVTLLAIGAALTRWAITSTRQLRKETVK